MPQSRDLSPAIILVSKPSCYSIMAWINVRHAVGNNDYINYQSSLYYVLIYKMVVRILF